MCVCVCVCVWGGVLSPQVLWLPSDLRALVQEMDPELQQTSGSQLPLEELQSNHIVKLNLHYSSMSAELVRSVCAFMCVCACVSVAPCYFQ